MNIDIKLKEFVEDGIKNGVFPCAAVGVCFKNGDENKKTILFVKNIINKNKKSLLINKKLFDIASLTKPFATVLSLLSLVKEKKLTINDKLIDILPDKDMSEVIGSVTIEQLLSHSAGFPDHREYYKYLLKIPVGNRKDLLFNLLLKEPLVYQPGSKVIYSDLGYMLLGILIEKISGMEQDYYFNKMITGPIGLEEHIFYNPIGSEEHRKEQFAPVEDCPWRGRVLQGEVSDENCWALGGVAGHAGLYGDIYGVLELTELIMDIWLGKRTHPNINSQDLTSFLQRRSTIAGNTWCLGFDTPTPGKSSSGKYLSTTSVGHLGFTGTSFWIDPERELAIVILSNRVHPSRDNELIKQFRPAFHDKVVELLGQQEI